VQQVQKVNEEQPQKWVSAFVGNAFKRVFESIKLIKLNSSK
jgi:hypothetical protein